MPRDIFDELQVHYGARERWEDTSYYWDNSDRNEPHVAIQLTESGRCFLEVEGVRQNVLPGYAFIIEVPSQTSYGYPEDADVPYCMSFISVFGSLAIQFARDIRKQFGPIVDLRVCPESLSIHQEIVECCEANEFRDRFEASARFFQFFAALYRELNQEVVRGDIIAACYQQIQNRFRDPVNISQIAQKSGVSREHLARSFHQRYGETPSHLLRRLRLDAAKRIIETGVQDMESVARSVGLNDVRTLRRYLTV